MTDKEKIIAEIDKIIDCLKTRCNPNPLGTTEECLVAAEIEVLELVKGTIAKMKKEEPIGEEGKLRKASEEYLKVLSETPYNNIPITNAQNIVRNLITFLDTPYDYDPDKQESPVEKNLSTKAVGVGLQLRDALIVDGVERETAEVFAAVAQQKFIDGANWQKKQDADLGSSAYERGYHDGREYEKGKSQKSNQDNSELADIEDSGEVKRVAEKWVRTYDKIYEKGKADIKKEMLKDAITTEIVNGWEYGKDEDHAKIPTIHIKGGINFSIGDKVRVIIIKED